MFARFAVALLLLDATTAMAADPSGSWVFRAGDKALFLFEVSRTTSGWTGVWVKPDRFESDGDSYSKVTGPVVRWKARSARAVGEAVELTFDDPRPGQMPSSFSIRAIDIDHAEAKLVGTPVGPLALSRQPKGAPFGGWDPKQTYVRREIWPSNAEMTAIFEADQGDREHWSTADHVGVAAADGLRRSRTQALLDAGLLRSGDDYLHAAFVFQHGDGPGDYLKAHILATVSVARGNPGATWIAAATLDRYLQAIGQPQILGTQYQIRDGKARQEPYDKALISDALREAMRVPMIEQQAVLGRSLEQNEASAKP